jgi:hypothetical protein
MRRQVPTPWGNGTVWRLERAMAELKIRQLDEADRKFLDVSRQHQGGTT